MGRDRTFDIRCLRLKLGWSAAELGRRLGCTADQVLDWEAGLAHPDAESLNHMHYLSAYVELNAMRTAQLPLAEVIMAREQLAQVTHEQVDQLDQE